MNVMGISRLVLPRQTSGGAEYYYCDGYDECEVVDFVGGPKEKKKEFSTKAITMGYLLNCFSQMDYAVMRCS